MAEEITVVCYNRVTGLVHTVICERVHTRIVDVYGRVFKVLFYTGAYKTAFAVHEDKDYTVTGIRTEEMYGY